MSVAEFKWYESRTFTWTDVTCVEQPSGEAVSDMLHNLKAEGWEDDPLACHGLGFVNVRRPYNSGRANSRADGLAAVCVHVYRISDEIKSLSSRFDERKVSADTEAMVAMGLRIEVMAEEMLRLRDQINQQPVTIDAPLGNALDTEFAGAPWVLTVKGGTR